MKKKTLLFILLIFLLIILGLLSYVFFNNLRRVQKDNYLSEFTTMTEELYSKYYYKVVSVGKTEEQLSEYLKKFEVIGLKFDLEALENYSDEYKEKVSDFIKKYDTCKKEDVYVTIKPKSPYGSKDFESEIMMECANK